MSTLSGLTIGLNATITGRIIQQTHPTELLTSARVSNFLTVRFHDLIQFQFVLGSTGRVLENKSTTITYHSWLPRGDYTVWLHKLLHVGRSFAHMVHIHVRLSSFIFGSAVKYAIPLRSDLLAQRVGANTCLTHIRDLRELHLRVTFDLLSSRLEVVFNNMDSVTTELKKSCRGKSTK